MKPWALVLLASCTSVDLGRDLVCDPGSLLPANPDCEDSDQRRPFCTSDKAAYVVEASCKRPTRRLDNGDCVYRVKGVEGCITNTSAGVLCCPK